MLRADQERLLAWVVRALAAHPATAARFAPHDAARAVTASANTPTTGATAPLDDGGAAVLTAIGVGPAPELSLNRFKMAGLATGLTALVEQLRVDLGLTVPDGWREHLAEQHREVEARQQHFAELLPAVLGALATAGIPAVPVKGAVLAAEVWPWAHVRPMADIDLVIAPADRAGATIALERAGLQLVSSRPWEDTFLAWGTGAVGRTDGESAAHNGKVELHPGLCERFHNYLVDDGGVVMADRAPGALGGVACPRLSAPAFAAHVLAHLSASVVRAEARALNIIDAVLVIGALDPEDRAAFARCCARLDARLVEPGLWAVAAAVPGASAVGVGDRMSDGDVSPVRLAKGARARLAGATVGTVLRDPDARTSTAWRWAFAQTWPERRALARQAVWPSPEDRPADTSAARLLARRAAQATTGASASIVRHRKAHSRLAKEG